MAASSAASSSSSSSSSVGPLGYFLEDAFTPPPSSPKMDYTQLYGAEPIIEDYSLPSPPATPEACEAQKRKFVAQFNVLIDAYLKLGQELKCDQRDPIEHLRIQFFTESYSGMQPKEFFKNVKAKMQDILLHLRAKERSEKVRANLYNEYCSDWVQCSPGFEQHTDNMFRRLTTILSLPSALAEIRNRIILTLASLYARNNRMAGEIEIHIEIALKRFFEEKLFQAGKLSVRSEEKRSLDPFAVHTGLSTTTSDSAANERARIKLESLFVDFCTRYRDEMIEDLETIFSREYSILLKKRGVTDISKFFPYDYTVDTIAGELLKKLGIEASKFEVFHEYNEDGKGRYHRALFRAALGAYLYNHRMIFSPLAWTCIPLIEEEKKDEKVPAYTAIFKAPDGWIQGPSAAGDYVPFPLATSKQLEKIAERYAPAREFILVIAIEKRHNDLVRKMISVMPASLETSQDLMVRYDNAELFSEIKWESLRDDRKMHFIKQMAEHRSVEIFQRCFANRYFTSPIVRALSSPALFGKALSLLPVSSLKDFLLIYGRIRATRFFGTSQSLQRMLRELPPTSYGEFFRILGFPLLDIAKLGGMLKGLSPESQLSFFRCYGRERLHEVVLDEIPRFLLIISAISPATCEGFMEIFGVGDVRGIVGPGVDRLTRFLELIPSRSRYPFLVGLGQDYWAPMIVGTATLGMILRCIDHNDYTKFLLRLDVRRFIRDSESLGAVLRPLVRESANAFLVALDAFDGHLVQNMGSTREALIDTLSKLPTASWRAFLGLLKSLPTVLPDIMSVNSVFESDDSITLSRSENDTRISFLRSLPEERLSAIIPPDIDMGRLRLFPLLTRGPCLEVIGVARLSTWVRCAEDLGKMFNLCCRHNNPILFNEILKTLGIGRLRAIIRDLADLSLACKQIEDRGHWFWLFPHMFYLGEKVVYFDNLESLSLALKNLSVTDWIGFRSIIRLDLLRATEMTRTNEQWCRVLSHLRQGELQKFCEVFLGSMSIFEEMKIETIVFFLNNLPVMHWNEFLSLTNLEAVRGSISNAKQLKNILDCIPLEAAPIFLKYLGTHLRHIIRTEDDLYTMFSPRPVSPIRDSTDVALFDHVRFHPRRVLERLIGIDRSPERKWTGDNERAWQQQYQHWQLRSTFLGDLERQYYAPVLGEYDQLCKEIGRDVSPAARDAREKAAKQWEGIPSPEDLERLYRGYLETGVKIPDHTVMAFARIRETIDDLAALRNLQSHIADFYRGADLLINDIRQLFHHDNPGVHYRKIRQYIPEVEKKGFHSVEALLSIQSAMEERESKKEVSASSFFASRANPLYGVIYKAITDYLDPEKRARALTDFQEALRHGPITTVSARGAAGGGGRRR